MPRFLLLVFCVTLGASANSQDLRLVAALDPDQQTGAVTGEVSMASGSGGLFYDAATDTLSWEFEFDGLTGPLIAAHIHGPAAVGASASVLIDLEPSSNRLTSPIIGQTVVGNPAIVTTLMQGMTYANLHTDANQAGEIRGQIVVAEDLRLVTRMDPDQETGAVSGDVAQAAGSGEFTYDAASDTLSWDFSFAGLTGPVIAMHIHGPADFGQGASVLIDLEPLSNGVVSPVQGSVAVGDPLVVSYLSQGLTYLNLHTGINQPGEIRGQLLPARDLTLISKIDSGQETGTLNGDVSQALGHGGLSYDAGTDTLNWEFTFAGLTGPVIGAHIHGPAEVGEDASVLIDLEPVSNGLISPIIGTVVVDDPLTINALLTGSTYVNLHTSANQPGEIRGQLIEAGDFKSVASLDPGQVLNPLSGDVSGAVGSGGISYDAASDTVSWSFHYEGLTGPVNLAHIHGPAKAGSNASVLIDLDLGAGLDSPIAGSTAVGDPLTVAYLANQVTYVNLHTTLNGGGEIRGQVLTPSDFFLESFLHPDQETAVVNGDVSAAQGVGMLNYDAASDSLTWNVTFADLTGPAIAAHIHGPANFGANGAVLIAIDGQGLTSPISGTASGIDAATLGHLVTGLTYFNIHTDMNQPGEIRGQIRPIVFRSGFEVISSH